MTLVFDTETTGKADFRLPLDHPSQPRLVQLGAILYDDAWVVRGELNVIIRPDGYKIPVEASSIHGITTEIAQRYGMNLSTCTTLFHDMCMKAETLVAHNIEFDEFMIEIECTRDDFGEDFVFPPNRFCTMKHMTDVCQIPGPYGFKWPRLQEAYQHCFGSAFDGAHNAMADVRACAEVYRWIQTHKEQSTPA